MSQVTAAVAGSSLGRPRLAQFEKVTYYMHTDGQFSMVLGQQGPVGPQVLCAWVNISLLIHPFYYISLDTQGPRMHNPDLVDLSSGRLSTMPFCGWLAG